MRELDLVLRLPPELAIQRLRTAAAGAGIKVDVDGGDVEMIVPSPNPRQAGMPSKAMFRAEGDGTRLHLDPATLGFGNRILCVFVTGVAAVIGFDAIRDKGGYLVLAILAGAALGSVFGGMIWLIVHSAIRDATDGSRRFVRETFADVSTEVHAPNTPAELGDAK